MKKPFVLILVLLILVGGCCKPQVVNKEDLQALQDLQEPIFKDYLKMVEENDKLEDAQKQARRLGVKAAQDFVQKSLTRFEEKPPADTEEKANE